MHFASIAGREHLTTEQQSSRRDHRAHTGGGRAAAGFAAVRSRQGAVAAQIGSAPEIGPDSTGYTYS
jgi:hypothetical protein